jgi:phage terminase large subunit
MPTSQITRKDAQYIIDVYKQIPHIYVQDMFQCEPWALQNDIVQAVFENPLVGVASCNAAGKSWLAARVALAFLELHPNSIVITTAPTWRQVKDVLWREIGTAYAESKFQYGPYNPTQVGLEINKKWFAVGMSTKDREKFFGYHADWILVIVDEASGVEEPIFEGVDAVTPNKNAHVFYIGNPTSLSGRFRKTFDDPLAIKKHISAFDTPNFTANNIKDLDDLLRLYIPPADADPIAHLKKVNDSLIDLPAYRGLISPGTVYRDSWNGVPTARCGKR